MDEIYSSLDNTSLDNTKKDVPVSFRMTQKQLDLLNKLCEHKKMNKAQFLNLLIEKYGPNEVLKQNIEFMFSIENKLPSSKNFTSLTAKKVSLCATIVNAKPVLYKYDITPELIQAFADDFGVKLNPSIHTFMHALDIYTAENYDDLYWIYERLEIFETSKTPIFQLCRGKFCKTYNEVEASFSKYTPYIEMERLKTVLTDSVDVSDSSLNKFFF